MIYALDSDLQIIAASPGTNGICPGCKGPVLAKCGTINIWHWAHEKDSDCDAWSEGESGWHTNWKTKVDLPVI